MLAESAVDLKSAGTDRLGTEVKEFSGNFFFEGVHLKFLDPWPCSCRKGVPRPETGGGGGDHSLRNRQVEKTIYLVYLVLF